MEAAACTYLSTRTTALQSAASEPLRLAAHCIDMASMGFSYAHIHVQRERCKLAAGERDDKTMAKAAMGASAGEGEGKKASAEKKGSKRSPIGEVDTGGVSWANLMRVHQRAQEREAADASF